MQLGRCIGTLLLISHLWYASSDRDQQYHLLKSIESESSQKVSPGNNLTETLAPSSVNLQTEDRTQESSIGEHISENENVIYVPKCCPRGSIVRESSCQPYEILDFVPKLDSKLSRRVKYFSVGLKDESVNLRHRERVTLECGYSKSDVLDQLSYENASYIKPKFRTSTKNDTLLFYLHYYKRNYWNLEYNLPSFCVDIKYVQSGGVIIYDAHVFHCLKPSSISKQYPALHCISAVGLVLTFILYFLTPTKGAARILRPGGAPRRPGSAAGRTTLASLLTGRNLLCHITSLFITFVCLAIAQQELVKPGESGCVAIGYITYLASIASFTWLTVYCFDYFWMFRGSFKVANSILFLPYSLFGWGLPVIALVIALIAQFNSESDLPESINPNMGLTRCWFSNETSALAFFYMPISILLSLNTIFFMTLLLNPNLMHCRKRNNGGPQLRSNKMKSSSDEKQQQDIKMAVKLFFITGIPWVFEIAAWVPTFLQTLPTHQREIIGYLFEISNVLNALRGVIIFILFVLLQRDVRAQLWLKISIISRNKSSLSKSDVKGDSNENKTPKRFASNQPSTSSSSFNTSSTTKPPIQQDPFSTEGIEAFSFEPDEVTVL